MGDLGGYYPHLPLFPYSLLPTPYSLIKPKTLYFTQLIIATIPNLPAATS
ncbi:MAG: hypothetical protein F6J90_38375 [Moorea sp. SIOASIH]|nr:hypothetical protein [Moorena sp. SIOASIH]NEO41877.1 hypothetical protein [Moorena sp. SIOASIH]